MSTLFHDLDEDLYSDNGALSVPFLGGSSPPGGRPLPQTPRVPPPLRPQVAAAGPGSPLPPPRSRDSRRSRVPPRGGRGGAPSARPARVTRSNPAPPGRPRRAAGRNSIGRAPHAPPPAGQWAAGSLHMQRARPGARPGRFGSTDAGEPAPGAALRLSPRPGSQEAAADGAAGGRPLAVRPRRLRRGLQEAARDATALGGSQACVGPRSQQPEPRRRGERGARCGSGGGRLAVRRGWVRGQPRRGGGARPAWGAPGSGRGRRARPWGGGEGARRQPPGPEPAPRRGDQLRGRAGGAAVGVGEAGDVGPRPKRPRERDGVGAAAGDAALSRGGRTHGVSRRSGGGAGPGGVG